MQHTKEMSKYRFEQAEQCFESARTLIESNDYKGSANRSYYSVFHSIRSVLALKNVDFKSHAAVISHFRKEYIKTNVFPTKMSDIIGELFTVRNKCDYDDFYIISKEEVVVQLESAEFFVSEVRNYLSSQP